MRYCLDRFVRTACSLATLAALMLAGVGTAYAHGDTHLQIALLDRQIAEHPREAALYAERSELHRIHQDWESASRDVEEAARLDPLWREADLARGRLLLEAGRPADALEPLNKYVRRNPQAAGGFLTRARTHAKLANGVAAAADYTKAFALQKAPTPDDFIARSSALLAAGPDHRAEALAGIEEGIARIGSIPTLELEAARIEEQLGRVDAALARLKRLEDRFERKDSWIMKRVELLERAGREREALQARADVLKTIEALPEWARNEPVTLKLYSECRAKLSAAPASDPH
jgi:tetratricopeptide (TPR) repeat protein